MAEQHGYQPSGQATMPPSNPPNQGSGGMRPRKEHWAAMTTAYRMSEGHQPIWALVYDPTPGGRKNEDGTTTYSLRFPALILAEYIVEPEKIAGQIAAKLNAYDDMLAALKALDRDARPSNWSDIDEGGPEYEAISRAQKAAWEALDAALAKAEGQQVAEGGQGSSEGRDKSP